MSLFISNLWSSESKEYLIYTYGGIEAGEIKSAERWTWHSRAKTLIRAIRKAHNLFDSGLYQKVEIKQKYYSSKKKQHIDKTCCVFEKSQKKKKRLILTLSFSVLCGIIAFWLTYMVLHNGFG